MLGKTLAEGLHILQGVLDRINLLVCFGYDPVAVSQPQGKAQRQTIETEDNFGCVESESIHNHNGAGVEVVV